MAKLGELYSITSGGTPSRKHPEYFEDGTISWVKTGDLKDKYLYITDEKITQKALDNSSAKLYPAETVLIAMYGATIGATSILKIDAATNQACAAFVKRDDILPQYLHAFLESQRERFIREAVGGAQPNISAGYLKKIDFPMCSMKKQKEVTTVLELLSNLINYRKLQLEKLDELVKSRFVEMFGRVCDNKYSYEVKSLQDVCEKIKDGTHQTPKYTDDTVSGYKFLSSKDVTTGRINWEHIKYIPEELHNELYAKIAPRRGDILLAKNGTTGIAAIVDTDEVFDIYVSLALLRPVDLNSVYLWAAINSYETKQQFDASLKGVGVPNLHLGEIKKTRILVPPLDLQNQFADFVAQVDKSKLAVQKSLEQLEILKKSLMQAYFG